jgi:hypothetical protein
VKDLMSLREGYLHDYLVASFIAFLFGFNSLAVASGGAGGDMAKFVGIIIVVDIFFVIPGGIVAAYLNFRFHVVGEKLEMEGLSAGFFTAIVYTIITLFEVIVSAVLNQAAAGNLFTGWIISVVFAFIFYMIGGWLGGFFERKPFGMPSIFNISRISRAPPPPPPSATQMCPTCGQPLTFVQQYNRWYCQNCKKYP